MTTSTLAAPLEDAVRMEEVPDPQVPERATRRSFTAKYKAEIVAEYVAECGELTDLRSLDRP